MKREYEVNGKLTQFKIMFRRKELYCQALDRSVPCVFQSCQGNGCNAPLEIKDTGCVDEINRRIIWRKETKVESENFPTEK